MKLEQQVTSLELSKRLKELGVKQESLFYWCVYDRDPTGQTITYLLPASELQPELECERSSYSAFTVAELGGGMLQYRIEDEKRKMFYFPTYTYKLEEDGFIGWVVSYNRLMKSIKSENEADCRAKMLIYLIENNLVNPKEL